MLIIVLGASSKIGRSLAISFSSGNELILVGRDYGRLFECAGCCKDAGAKTVETVAFDMLNGVGPLVSCIGARYVDLLVDSASAASAKKDLEVGESEIVDLITVDVSSRRTLLTAIKNNQSAGPAVILISTVLTLVHSPGREIYSSIKRLSECYYRNLSRARPTVHYLVVHVGKVISRERESRNAGNLASTVASAFGRREKVLIYGTSGRLFVLLYNLQPILFRTVVYTRRIVAQMIRVRGIP